MTKETEAKLASSDVAEMFELVDLYQSDERWLRRLGLHQAAAAIDKVRRELNTVLSDYCKGCERHLDDCSDAPCDLALEEEELERDAKWQDITRLRSELTP